MGFKTGIHVVGGGRIEMTDNDISGVDVGVSVDGPGHVFGSGNRIEARTPLRGRGGARIDLSGGRLTQRSSRRSQVAVRRLAMLDQVLANLEPSALGGEFRLTSQLRAALGNRFYIDETDGGTFVEVRKPARVIFRGRVIGPRR